MKIDVVGVSGSPVKNGNVEAFLDRMIETAESRDEVGAEAIHLSRREVRGCIHCNFCLRKQEPGRYCSQKDDLQPVFERIERADVLILASPVYFMRTSGQMASFLDRLRVFVFGNVAGGKLRNKVGVSLAVAWGRNAGLETTHLSHIYAFLAHEMIPVGVHHSGSPLGISALATEHGMGAVEKGLRHGALQDAMAANAAEAMIDRGIGLARTIKAGSLQMQEK